MAAPQTATSEIRRHGGLDVLGWPAFDGLGLDAIVTTRSGGVSAGPYESLNLSLSVGDEPASVLENRRRVAAALGARLEDMVFCNQSHERAVHVATQADRGRGAFARDSAIGATDALVTAEPGVVLAVMVGDCVPVVLYDPVAHVLGCVHAGWRGTLARVCEAAVTAMRELGSDASDIIAGIGPAVARDGYQVGDEVFGAARACFGRRAGEVIAEDGTGRWLFDLWAANQVVLTEAGVPREHLHVTSVPTGSRGGGLFFSDREERPCGRFAAVAYLHPRRTP